MKLTHRFVYLMRLPVPESVHVMHAQFAILDVGKNEGTHDIGALCYSRRSRLLGTRENGGRPCSERLVDLSSLVSTRLSRIASIIEIFSEMQRYGCSPATIYLTCRYFISFCDWSELDQQCDYLTNFESSKLAFTEYSAHLRERVNQGKIGQNTAAAMQRGALKVLNGLYEPQNFSTGIVLIRSFRHATTPTEPPTEEAQARVLALCGCLFNGLADLCLDFQRFPFALTVPPTMGASEDILWVFPTNKWCMPPHEIKQRSNVRCGNWAFDYKNGRLAILEDIVENYSYNPAKESRLSRGQVALERARRQLSLANGDKFHSHRRDAGAAAARFHLILFLANTGMSLIGALTLPWGDEFEVGTERQGFRTIKSRAQGRVVAFEIQAVFLPSFKRYLKLRTYLLNGESSNYLYFGSRLSDAPRQRLTDVVLETTLNVMLRLDPGLPRVTARQWRAGKSDWLIRRADVATTALILQNSESVVRTSYTAGSQTQQVEEFGNFLNELEKRICHRDARLNEVTDTAVAACSAHGKPQQVMVAPIKSDCRVPEGCLFCDKFEIHPDEIDARKLLSCRYCIRKTIYMIETEEQIQNSISPILERIEFFLAIIERAAPGLCARIELEVRQGELDRFWAAKLEMLMELDLLI